MKSKKPQKTSRKNQSKKLSNFSRDPIALAVESLESRQLLSVPNGPFAASAAFSNNAINVTWHDSATNETGFRIERETVGGSFSTVGTVAAGVTSFSDKIIASQTQYEYRITAFNASGNSSSTLTPIVTSGTLDSNSGAFQGPSTGSYTIPNGPFGLKATATSSSSISLSWNSSSGGTESGFKILRSVNGGAYTLLKTTAAGVTTATDSGLTAGTTYSYKVAAYSLGGDSTYSGPVSATTSGTASSGGTGGTTTGGGTATSIPNGPFQLSANSVTGGIALKWYSSSGGTESGFTIMRSTNGGSTWSTLGTTGSGVTTYTDTAVTAGTTYTYKVCAFNSKGSSSFTAPASVTAGSTGSGTGSGSGTGAGTGTGTGPSSTAGSGINFKPSGGTNKIPYGPFGLVPTGATTKSITLSWYSSSNGSEGGFVIYRKYGPNGVYVPVGVTATNVLTWTDNNVTSGTKYTYEVAAFSSAGLSNYAGPLTCSPLPTSGVSASGTPTWPAGFFSIGAYLQPNTSMATWKSRGVNTMWDYQTNLSWLDIWNQSAEAAGMKIIRNAGVNPADDIGDPNLLAYLITDEPDIKNMPASALQSQYNAIKAYNPNVPVVLNVSAANVINMLDPTPDSTYVAYGKAADIWSSDVYPLSTYGDPSYIDLLSYKSPYAPQWDRGPANPGNGVEQLRNITQAADGPKSEIAFIETSDQGNGMAGHRAPTADEFRGEVWDSIIHGARGICYFPFAFPSSTDGTPPALVSEMTKQDAIITSLAPVITSFNDATPQEITGLPKGIEGMYRKYNGHTYFFIFNMSHTAQSNMKITLPGVTSATATVVNEGRTATISGGSLTDSFGAYGLHIYEV